MLCQSSARQRAESLAVRPLAAAAVDERASRPVRNSCEQGGRWQSHGRGGCGAQALTVHGLTCVCAFPGPR